MLLQVTGQITIISKYFEKVRWHIDPFYSCQWRGLTISSSMQISQGEVVDLTKSSFAVVKTPTVFPKPPFFLMLSIILFLLTQPRSAEMKGKEGSIMVCQFTQNQFFLIPYHAGNQECDQCTRRVDMPLHQLYRHQPTNARGYPHSCPSRHFEGTTRTHCRHIANF